ncbi:hypothetical protein SeLEV6574_g05260 [Synchytrium endobioticum]|uniref:Disease resistance R13L4/SHOC-2-like LRR domain-containing protein n=1 Tax=Synchytrium endobioticum TaxID=286115 RepID=A0A507CV44_9FUNG|nr:hypothetical protein SeLEV6574_g05260 [Synchytrium endobioticum]
MGQSISKDVSKLAFAYSKEAASHSLTDENNGLLTTTTTTNPHNRISPSGFLSRSTSDDTIYELGHDDMVEPSIATLTEDDLLIIDEDEGYVIAIESSNRTNSTLSRLRRGPRATFDVARLKNIGFSTGNNNAGGLGPWNTSNGSESVWNVRNPSMLCRPGGGGKTGKDLYSKKRVRAITFGQLASLSTIGLCSQGLVKLSPFIGFLSTTTTLQLCCNELTSIPAEIGYMKNLMVLSVAKNKLNSLPETIGYLTRLVELRASENQIASIPSTIGSLTKLTTLSLEVNKITNLPQEIGQLRNLINLDLSDNPLSILPAEIGRLKYLRKLRLDNCPLLAEISVDTSYNPPSLKELTARVIVRNQLPILHVMHDALKQYLASVRTCSFCGGPYFDSYVVRGKLIDRNESKVPLEYRLCVPHWTTEQDRILQLFACPPPPTAPSLGSAISVKQNKGLYRSSNSKSSNNNYSSKHLSMTSSTVPLSSLSRNPDLPPLPTINSSPPPNYVSLKMI